MPPLNLELRNTPHEFQIDLIGWYVTTGQLDKAIEQIKYGDLDDIVHDITGGKGQSEADTFKNVGKLKAGTDDFDKCYIFKTNC